MEVGLCIVRTQLQGWTRNFWTNKKSVSRPPLSDYMWVSTNTSCTGTDRLYQSHHHIPELEIITKRSKVTQTLELKPNLTRLDAERVYSSVSRKKCQQSKKLRQVSQLYAPVITFISGCGESDGGVTDQKAAFWHLQVWLQQTFLCLPRQKKTIFLAGSQGISSCVCLRNKPFFFWFLDTSSQNRYFRPTRGAWAGAWAKRGEARNRKLRLAMLCNFLTFLWFLQKRTLPTCVLVIGLRYKPATGQLV